jgi:hypothetical protein
MIGGHQRGAALLSLMAVVVTAATIAGAVALQRMASHAPTQRNEGYALALAAEALRGQAFQRRCLDTSIPLPNLLPCPDAAGVEGVADASCVGLTQGWLPWRTLGLPPLRDSSGTCLWYERNGTSARVIAAGAPVTGQTRTSLGSRPICGGNNAPASYVNANDRAVAVNLDTALMIARCP